MSAPTLPLVPTPPSRPKGGAASSVKLSPTPTVGDWGSAGSGASAATPTSFAKYTPSVLDAMDARARGEFYLLIDLAASRKRVGDFVDKYPRISSLINEARVRRLKIGYRCANPDDYADYHIAQMLCFSREETLLDGSKVCDSLNDWNPSDHVISDMKSDLILALKKIHEEHPADNHVTTLLALHSKDSSVKESKELYRQAASNGYALAQVLFATLDTDRRKLGEEEMGYLSKAAANNYSRAQYELGCRYESHGALEVDVLMGAIFGRDVPRDGQEAARLFQLASDNGYAPAAKKTGDIRHLADNGYAEAQMDLALSLRSKTEAPLPVVAKFHRYLGLEEGVPLLDGDTTLAIRLVTDLFRINYPNRSKEERERELSRYKVGGDEIFSIFSKTDPFWFDFSVDKDAANTPLTADQIIDIINVLGKTPEIAARRIAQDRSTLIGDLVEVSPSLSDDDLRRIHLGLLAVPGLDAAKNQSCKMISKKIKVVALENPLGIAQVSDSTSRDSDKSPSSGLREVSAANPLAAVLREGVGSVKS